MLSGIDSAIRSNEPSEPCFLMSLITAGFVTIRPIVMVSFFTGAFSLFPATVPAVALWIAKGVPASAIASSVIRYFVSFIRLIFPDKFSAP